MRKQPRAVRRLHQHVDARHPDANVRIKDRYGWTPLLLVARTRASTAAAIVNALFRAGADPTDTQGTWNALMYAAHNGNAATVVSFLEHGVEVGVTGRSPLHLAAARGHAGIVEILLAAGADSAARDIDGSTPADKATSREVLALLTPRP